MRKKMLLFTKVRLLRHFFLFCAVWRFPLITQKTVTLVLFWVAGLFCGYAQKGGWRFEGGSGIVLNTYDKAGQGFRGQTKAEWEKYGFSGPVFPYPDFSVSGFRIGKYWNLWRSNFQLEVNYGYRSLRYRDMYWRQQGSNFYYTGTTLPGKFETQELGLRLNYQIKLNTRFKAILSASVQKGIGLKTGMFTTFYHFGIGLGYMTRHNHTLWIKPGFGIDKRYSAFPIFSPNLTIMYDIDRIKKERKPPNVKGGWRFEVGTGTMLNTYTGAGYGFGGHSQYEWANRGVKYSVFPYPAFSFTRIGAGKYWYLRNPNLQLEVNTAYNLFRYNLISSGSLSPGANMNLDLGVRFNYILKGSNAYKKLFSASLNRTLTGTSAWNGWSRYTYFYLCAGLGYSTGNGHTLWVRPGLGIYSVPLQEKSLKRYINPQLSIVYDIDRIKKRK